MSNKKGELTPEQYAAVHKILDGIEELNKTITNSETAFTMAGAIIGIKDVINRLRSDNNKVERRV